MIALVQVTAASFRQVGVDSGRFYITSGRRLAPAVPTAPSPPRNAPALNAGSSSLDPNTVHRGEGELWDEARARRPRTS